MNTPAQSTLNAPDARKVVSTDRHALSKTEASRYIEAVHGIIIGDIPPPQVSARLLRAETMGLPNNERQIIYRQDGFANDAEGRKWAEETVEQIKRNHGHRYKEVYPHGFELQLHAY